MRRLALVAMWLVACGRGADERTADGGRQTADTSRVALSTTLPSAVSCPPTGLWAECSVIDRLDRAGLVPRRDTSVNGVDTPPLTLKGTRLKVSRADLDIFVYRDEAARTRESRLLDPTKYLAFDAAQTMQPLPTLIVSANLIAVLHSRNDHLRERVADAIMAGPPQPLRPLIP